MTVTTPITLYGSPHSQFTYKVALMLRLSAQPFAFRYVNFQTKMQLTPEFSRLSRWNQVPVLRYGDETLVQSGAILEFLAEGLGCFAGEAGTRLRIREWLYWNADRLAPPIYGLYGAALGARGLLPNSVPPVVEQDHRRRAALGFAALDAALDGRSVLVGERLTIADLCCYGEAAFAQLADFALGSWPNVVSWAARIAGLAGHARPLDLLPRADHDFLEVDSTAPAPPTHPAPRRPSCAAGRG